MNQTKEVNVNVTENTKELVISNGEALPLREPRKMEVEGIIDTPFRFLSNRKPDTKNCHILIDRNKMAIVLVVDEKSEFCDMICGELEIHEDFKQFQINAQGEFTLQKLADLLKRTRFFFPDKEENMNIVTELLNYKGNINTEIEKTKDTRGNNKNLIDQKVTGNIPLSFTLKVPIFKGKSPVTFKVEIGVNARSNDVSVWLESVEVYELILEERDKAIDFEIGRIKELDNYLILEV